MGKKGTQGAKSTEAAKAAKGAGAPKAKSGGKADQTRKASKVPKSDAGTGGRAGQPGRAGATGATPRTPNFEKGVALRRELGGSQLVENAFKDPSDFGYPMEELVTEVAWGMVWGRPGLDRRTRSLLNIGLLAALNRPDQMAGHVRIAIKNGVTREEIQECLLQVAGYAGMPAGLASFKVAKQVLSELEV